MAGLRVFLENKLPGKGETLTLPPDEGRHLAKALRARPGDAVELLDGCGHRIAATFVAESGRSAEVEVHSISAEPPPSCPVTLLQAIPKGKAFESIIQVATEIGAARIIPVLSDHCEVKLDAPRAESKQKHWLACAREACKQSGHPWLLDIATPQKLADAVNSISQHTLCIVASLEGEPPPIARLVGEHLSSGTPAGITLAIGPEGDFSKAEYQLLADKGFQPVRLGNNVLRSKTAATYTLSIIDALLKSLSA